MRCLGLLLVLLGLNGCQTCPPHIVQPEAVRFLNFVPAHAYSMGFINCPANSFPLDRKITIDPVTLDFLRKQAAQLGANCIYTGLVEPEVNLNGNTTLYLQTYWLPPTTLH